MIRMAYTIDELKQKIEPRAGWSSSIKEGASYSNIACLKAFVGGYAGTSYISNVFREIVKKGRSFLGI